MKCNGCGGEIETLAAAYGYDNVSTQETYYHPTVPDDKEMVLSQYQRTFCVKCHQVLKNIILNSDLSDHWSQSVTNTSDDESDNLSDHWGE